MTRWTPAVQRKLDRGEATLDDRGNVVSTRQGATMTEAERMNDAWVREYQPNRARAMDRAQAARDLAANTSPQAVADLLATHEAAYAARLDMQYRVGRTLDPFDGELTDVQLQKVAETVGYQSAAESDQRGQRIDLTSNLASGKREADALVRDLERQTVLDRARDALTRSDELDEADLAAGGGWTIEDGRRAWSQPVFQTEEK